jgi:pyruvate ferredoxin oxidoreductase gamma subunit
VGVISRESLAQAVRTELAPLGESVVARNLAHTLPAYDLMAGHIGCVCEGRESTAEAFERPQWVDLPFENAGASAPAIFAPATSAIVSTGLWRTVRPVLDYAHCRRCAWICSTMCPDSSISVNAEGYPEIDYEHCKGCLICMANCPAHAIRAVPEHEAAEKKMVGGGQGPQLPGPSPRNHTGGP